MSRGETIGACVDLGWPERGRGGLGCPSISAAGRGRVRKGGIRPRRGGRGDRLQEAPIREILRGLIAQIARQIGVPDRSVSIVVFNFQMLARFALGSIPHAFWGGNHCRRGDHTEHFEKCRQDPYGAFCQNSLPRPNAGSAFQLQFCFLSTLRTVPEKCQLGSRTKCILHWPSENALSGRRSAESRNLEFLNSSRQELVKNSRF